jgi:hypothetical protein
MANLSAAEAAGPPRCGGSPAGDQPDLGQAQRAAHVVGQAQVTVVDGIEGPAQEGDRRLALHQP